MPKTNDASGATYAGYEGVVEHAGGAGSTRPGGLSELDPSRNIDGTVVDGYESDEREMEDGATDGTVVGEVRPAEQPTDNEPLDSPQEEEAKKEEQSSPGTSFSASQKNSAATNAKNGRGSR